MTLASSQQRPQDPLQHRIPLLRVQVDALDLHSLLSRLEAFIGSHRSHQIITANALMILAADRSPELAEVFQKASLVVPDSAGVRIAAGLRGHHLPETIPGVELIEHLCALAVQKDWGLFLLGGSSGTAQKTAEILKRRHTGLRVLGTHHGHFSREEEESVVHRIAEMRPDLLFVALGIPRQELWIYRHLSRLNAKVAMGVGGSFDVISGRLRRAPPWMRAIGLEWLFRLLQEPWRTGRMSRLPLFFMKVLFQGFHSPQTG